MISDTAFNDDGGHDAASREPSNIFGTDGIRGVGGRGWLAPEGLRRIATAAVALAGRLGHPAPTVLIARDPRESGAGIEQILAATLIARGATVRLAGILPTPAVSVLVADGAADLGMVISASHNPPEFNGLKFFGPDGAKLSVAEEERITADALAAPADPPDPASEAPPVEDLRERYLDALLRGFGGVPFLTGLTIGLDCARGATAVCAVDAFRRAGAEVFAIHAELDGARINIDCGSTHPEALASAVRERGADLGVAFDGDGDRAILVDETGAVVDGDEMMALWALDLRRRGALPGNRIVTTVMSNAGMERFLAEQEIEISRTRVGDREVYQEMLRGGLALGGEQSGHLIEGGVAATGDGIRTGLQLAKIIRDSGHPLSELRAPIPRYPQTLVGVEVAAKPSFHTLPEVQQVVDEAEHALADRGRVLLRYSGTEPLARVLVEGSDAQENALWAERIAEALRAHPATGAGSES